MSAAIERWEPPNDPAAFESLCLELWREIWHDPSAQKNGRRGQPQAGVDVFGQNRGKWAGVQCKQKDGLVRSKVTVKELEAEVEAAKQFNPPLATFLLATTGPRDAKVQKRAREFTEEHRQQGLFSVEVWSWEDIWDELYRRDDLLTRIAANYWPRLVALRWPGEALIAPARMLGNAEPEPAPERLTTREKTAGEILGNLKSIKLSYQFRERVEELYLGRWPREPGWQATVDDLPSKLSERHWFCAFREVSSGTLVLASTLQDVSALRPGDPVTINGRISSISPLGSVSLEEATVRNESVPGAHDLK